ncbi:TIGR04283 family arsenosugar biosynthesis glycosyltransferase [Litoreibacter arenae]|uniref:Glycosyl transferase, group 2 family protein n=1 Tax=Litoreibacter arenae DSM 19593 TaxID=1123360 RepID=S9QHC6_9RHOB|nr:TIGR04283 family arsenosugar biosynthesis glycosyltransferase [Litoreibacter arenae]EPX80871.1 Glycosyl transferase, group 2 family protein [Litoreibacter arenae DSM 19593]
MAAPFSIVIPTLNAEAHLPATLNALMPGLEAGLIRDLVISDGGSEDGTLGIARAAGAEVVGGPKGRGGQLRRGAEVARGEWLLFLHADTCLAPDWVGAAAVHRETHPNLAAAFRLRFRAKGLAPRVVAGWANRRSTALNLPYGDQGLLMSRALYEYSGGYPDQPLMEDVAMAKALKGRVRLLDTFAETGAERYERNGWLRQSLRNFGTLTRYSFGADPRALAQRYHKD